MNVVGGVRVDEPGCDLAVALAVASASRGVPLSGAPRACFGELGLTGELRWVGHPERRLQEAGKHGLQDVIAPPGSGGQACEAATLREALRARVAERAAARGPSCRLTALIAAYGPQMLRFRPNGGPRGGSERLRKAKCPRMVDCGPTIR